MRCEKWPTNDGALFLSQRSGCKEPTPAAALMQRQNTSGTNALKVWRPEPDTKKLFWLLTRQPFLVSCAESWRSNLAHGYTGCVDERD